MDNLIDTVFELIKDEYTLNGSVINSTPINILNAGGYFHPYSLATLIFKVLVR